MTPLFSHLLPPERNPAPPVDEAAELRALLAGDEAATQRFHDRLRDLDRRFDAWKDADIENEIKAIWWRASVRCGVELRP